MSLRVTPRERLELRKKAFAIALAAVLMGVLLNGVSLSIYTCKNWRLNWRIIVRYTRKVCAVKQCSLQLAMALQSLCHNRGRVVSHPHVTRGLTNFCDTEFSPFLKGWDSGR
ncbi:hypothetical protein ACB092_02G155000 [Castanea dentata]